MKKRIAIIFLFLFALPVLGCQPKSDPENIKLVEFDEYSTMTIDGTTSIEVEYYYRDHDETYEFVIEDGKTIDNIMTAIFDMELKKYPDDADVDPYANNEIIVIQGDTDYSINLFDAHDGKHRYLCQSGAISKLLKEYIEANLIA